MLENIIKRKSAHYIFLLILINILAHYLPFERLSLSPDDYSRLLKPAIGFKNFIFGPSDRPLHFFLLEIQNLYIKDNPHLGFLINLLSNTFLLIVIWNFLNLFYEDKKHIFLILIVYILLFNKIEIYHTPIYSINVFAGIFYILSIYYFISGLNNNNNFNFIISLLFYILGIFLYEIGFFVIIIYFYYFYFNRNVRIATYLSLFILISIFYVSYRLTNSFGNSEIVNSHNLNIEKIPYGFIDLFHNYIGRTAIRILIYGLYQFLYIEKIWLLIIIILNLVFIVFLFFKNIEIKEKKENSNILIFIIIFIVFSIPPILNGMSGGRHTIVPDISLSILLVHFFIFYLKKGKSYFIIFVIVSILINQGNSWAQVVSCRINNAIYEYIKEIEYKTINDYDYIIFDQGSFSKNISHSLLNNDKILERYFGAQALEDQTVITMLALNKNFQKKEVTERFHRVIEYKKNSEDNYSLSKITQTGYRKFNYEKINIKSENVLIIDYYKVYNNGYINGNR